MKHFIKYSLIVFALGVLLGGPLTAQDQPATNTVVTEQSPTNTAPSDAAAPAETTAPDEGPAPTTPTPPPQDEPATSPEPGTRAGSGTVAGPAEKAVALAAVGTMGFMAVVFISIYVVMIAVLIISMWKIFVKAGEPGWASIVPFYNGMIMCKIAGKPMWWIFLCLIPCANVIFAFLIFMGFARNFGKDVGFAVGLCFVGIIFFPILAFGNAQYLGPNGAWPGAAPSPATPPPTA